jgi:catechol 2,3-dioxygenase-like lactoylglutathione lyase family enzyme
MYLSRAKAFTSFSVPDMDKAKSFYAETLGLKVEQTPMGLELHIGGGGLPVFIYQSNDYHAPEHTVLNFIVDDVDSAIEDLGDKGVKMEIYHEDGIDTDDKGVMRTPPGQPGPKAIAWFKDPAGHILSLIEQ